MTLQATCHLTRVHITLAGNSATGVTAGSAGSIGGGGSRGEENSLDGEFRTYLNGATRLLLGTATTKVQTLALRALTPSQLTTLLSMAGKTCLFRDTYGARFYGSFLVTDQTTIPLTGDGTALTVTTDVGLAIQQVTYDEEV